MAVKENDTIIVQNGYLVSAMLFGLPPDDTKEARMPLCNQTIERHLFPRSRSPGYSGATARGNGGGKRGEEGE